MDFPSGLNRRYATVAITLLVGIWLWVAFDRPYKFPDHIPWNIYSNSPQAPPNDVFDFPPLTSPAIKSVCEKTQWNSSLIFTCDSPSGNFAEVRNSILHCVRYAMAAGGSLVIPKIILNEDYGGLVAGNTTGLDHLFDVDHFTKSLELSCPQLQLYGHASDVKGVGHEPVSLAPETLLRTGGATYASDWRDALSKWLTKYISADTEGPVIISLSRSYLHYPIHSDDEKFALHFGKILRIRSDARHLATTAFFELKHNFAKLGFLAAYLDTAPNPDRLTKEDQDYARYEKQSQLYLDYAVANNISTIYIASSRGIDIPRFVLDATTKNIIVKGKFDLLSGTDLETLKDMTTIQREMVDYLIMATALVKTHIPAFIGVGFSSFCWNIALKRFGREVGVPSDPGQLLHDGFNVLYGKAGERSAFQESMWG